MVKGIMNTPVRYGEWGSSFGNRLHEPKFILENIRGARENENEKK